MRRIILLLIVFINFTFGGIDECKTDVYFGNGILTEDWQAEDSAELLELAIIEKFGTNYYNKHVGKVDYAYNSTHLGGLNDLLESVLQKTNLAERIDALSKLNDGLKKTAHETDLSLQIQKYTSSIKTGHKNI